MNVLSQEGGYQMQYPQLLQPMRLVQPGAGFYSAGRGIGFLLLLFTTVWCLDASTANSKTQASGSQVARGKYLVQFGSCRDCHTPGHFTGKDDESRKLGGGDVGFLVPGLGIFQGPNLTPDKQTGLGNWTREQIVTAITTGVLPDGRILSTIMPWQNFAALTKSDAEAIAIYLKSLPPVHNKVGGPYGESEKVPIPVMKIEAPAATSK
jgi:mono/diheme cytochrome c family protein